MDYDSYFENHLTKMTLHTKKQLSLNNWYFQKSETDVDSSTRQYSVAKNALVPVIFEDKSSDFKNMDRSKKKKKQTENQAANVDHEESDDDDDHMSGSNSEVEVEQVPPPVLDDDPPVLSDDPPVSNKRFGLIAYKIVNIETELSSLVVSDPGGPGELRPCDFDAEGAKFVFSYENGITSKKSNASQIVKVDVKNWFETDIAPIKVGKEYKLQSAQSFITNKYGVNHKNVYQRLLYLNNLIKKTPLSAYANCPFGLGNSNAADENSLVNNLEVMPAFTILSEPKYGNYNVDQATLNKLAMLATATNDPVLARETIIKEYDMEKKAQREAAKLQRQQERLVRQRADPVPVAEEQQPPNTIAEPTNVTAEVTNDEENTDEEEMFLDHAALSLSHRQLNIKMDTVLHKRTSIIHVLKVGDENVNTYGYFMDERVTKRQRILEVRLNDGSIVSVSITNAYLLQQI